MKEKLIGWKQKKHLRNKTITYKFAVLKNRTKTRKREKGLKCRKQKKSKNRRSWNGQW